MAVKILVEKFMPHQCPAIANCPVGALSQKDATTPPVVDTSKCIECGQCMTVCSNGEFFLET